MPPPLALLLCTGFVLFLLRLDCKQATGVSRASWIPTLWLLLEASRPLSRWLDADTPKGLLDYGFLAGLLLLALLTLTRRRLDWSRVMSEQRWLMLLVSYMLASILWSARPFDSLKGWGRECAAVAMALVVLTERDPIEAAQSVLRRTVYILIPFSLLLIKYYPGLGVVYSRWSGGVQWVGVTLHKSQIGLLCMICGFFLIWTLSRRWYDADYRSSRSQRMAEILLLLMSMFLLKGPSIWAASVTSTLGLVFGISILFLLRWARKRRVQFGTNRWVAILACIIVVGTITPLLGASYLGTFTSALGRNATMTGRTDIWAGLVEEIEERPIVGYGFGTFWSPEMYAKHLEVNEAHQGYLDILLGLGAVGLAFSLFFALSSFRKAAAALDGNYEWASLCICYWLMAEIGRAHV